MKVYHDTKLFGDGKSAEKILKVIKRHQNAYLLLFYSTMSSKNMKELSGEMEALFAVSYMWWYTASNYKNPADEPCRE